ncbi:FecR domain-containing protein [Rhodopseudomonas palustris]|uniref:FecR family protein n=1 Tax=Rhodopseudomonas palustris TaxID=1076 RepID=UPI002ACDC54A|nr:FecR domain-containing protein [Rhodopseudomonas palustris]WQH00487.1 FecR domain-containing protein [Rhodopseudomonas palustris]
MSAADETPELDAVQRQALAWVIRLNSGEATSDDAAALAMWRKRGPEYEETFREAVRQWHTFGDATRELLGRTDAAPTRPVRSRVVVSRRFVIGGSMAAAAAVGGVYVAAQPPLGLWPSIEELAADYRTGKGERRTIALAQNMAVKLNTQTALSVRSAASAPRVELVSGEAAVDVKSQAAAVAVDAGGGRIETLEANFNVRCIDHKVSLVCFSGALQVDWKGQRAALTTSQQLTYSEEGGLTPVSPADPEQATAWQRGLLLVRDWPVERLVAEINRYRPGRIVIMDDRLGRRMISGTFYLDHLDDVVAQVRGLFGASARTLPGGILLLS